MGDIPRLVPRGAGLHRLQDTRESPTKAPPAAQALKRAAPRAAEASRAGVERPALTDRNKASVSVQQPNKRTQVYLMQDETGHVKVGLSNNPHKRLTAIQTGNPKKVELVAAHDAGETPKVVEDALHFYLRDIGAGAEGEWFSPSIFTTILTNAFCAGSAYDDALKVGLYLHSTFGKKHAELEAKIADLEEKLRLASAGKPAPASVPQPKGFDRKAYQRELMRKRRAAGKA